MKIILKEGALIQNCEIFMEDGDRISQLDDVNVEFANNVIHCATDAFISLQYPENATFNTNIMIGDYNDSTNRHFKR